MSELSEEESQKGGSEHSEEEEEEEETNEDTPFIAKQPHKRPYPFIALLLAFYPFGEDFRQLGIMGKIYEIVKVLL